MTRFWLRGNVDQASLEPLGVRFGERNGRTFVETHEDPLDPTVSWPALSPDVVDHVTHRDDLLCGMDLHPDGIYIVSEGVRLMLSSKVASPLSPDDIVIVQVVSAIAPTLAQLQDLLRKVYSGELKPTECWGRLNVSCIEGES
jgi:hypothetical protein